jgi:hypothetical protein
MMPTGKEKLSFSEGKGGGEGRTISVSLLRRKWAQEEREITSSQDPNLSNDQQRFLTDQGWCYRSAVEGKEGKEISENNLRRKILTMAAKAAPRRNMTTVYGRFEAKRESKKVVNPPRSKPKQKKRIRTSGSCSAL